MCAQEHEKLKEVAKKYKKAVALLKKEKATSAAYAEKLEARGWGKGGGEEGDPGCACASGRDVEWEQGKGFLKI